MSLMIDTPLSAFSIPIVSYIGLYPFHARFRLIRRTIGWDNVQPRQNRLRVEKEAPHILNLVDRYEGAHKNGLEVFPLWTTAVVLGNYAGLRHRTLNITAIAYICLRLLYNFVYINQRTQTQGWIRTCVHVLSSCLPTGLIIAAANNLRLGLGHRAE